MASITIRDLDAAVKERLRVRAAMNGRSMEAEARSIIETAVATPYSGMNIGQAFRKLGEELGGLDDVPWPSRADEPGEGPAVFSEEWESERAVDDENIPMRPNGKRKRAA